jgi:hypothetical protein
MGSKEEGKMKRIILLACVATLIPSYLTGCRVCPHRFSCDFFPSPDGPVTQLTSSPTPTVVFEDNGTIIVYHGSGCAESNKSGTQNAVLVEESLNLPRYAGNATVFLNGWYLQYLHGDHKVAGLATSIYNIRLEDGPTGKIVRWRTAGILSDKNFDDPYTWCYNYTVVAWNPVNLALVVDHDDGPCSDKPEETRDANYFATVNADWTHERWSDTMLSSFPTFIQNPGFTPYKTVAILPRGFGFAWTASCDDGKEDHNLVQLAYNMDHPGIFMEKNKKYLKGTGDTTRGDESTVNQGYVSWETYAIFKDNDSLSFENSKHYGFGEIVSGVSGSEVGVVQPPFSILTKVGESDDTCVPPADVTTHDFCIEDIPFKYAIPMLTGWEVYYYGSDHHVQKVGTRIDEWDYDYNNPGKLHYKLSAVLRDKDGSPCFGSRHKVTILGLRPVTLSQARSSCEK